jgi:hypothetical protein
MSMIADVLLTRTAVLAAAMAAVLSLPVEASDFGGFNGGFHGGFNGGFNGGNAFFRHRAIGGSSFNHRFDSRRNVDLRRGLPLTGRDRLLPIDRRDFARDRLLPIDRQGFRRADFARNGRFVYDGMGFTEASRFRPTRIDQLGGSSYSNGGSSVMVIVSNRPDYDTFGTHAGSAYGGGGAYVVSSGYPLYGDAAPAGSQSGAKIINVAKMRSACSYEHGVCVIRP